MPGQRHLQVKCEPPSEDEDSDSQFSLGYLTNKLTFSSVKLETEPAEENVGIHLLHLQGSDTLEELAPLAPAAPTATPVCVKQEPAETPPSNVLETLEPASHNMSTKLIDRHMTILNGHSTPDFSEFVPLLSVKNEPSLEEHRCRVESESEETQLSGARKGSSSPKGWTQRDMESALDALREQKMSLTKASAAYGIPSTTLWQRAHRLGIDTPKKEGGAKSWSERDLCGALQALRAGELSANKASKAFGIPSSTLYKIARREGIRLAAPFNAAPTAWRRADLARALHAIRAGAASVQAAAARFGIPSGTLYGRCKREGIELARATAAPWSERAMEAALRAVAAGHMSINQAAIHFNLPYSSLYGRFKRCKYQMQQPPQHQLVPEYEYCETTLAEAEGPPVEPYAHLYWPSANELTT